MSDGESRSRLTLFHYCVMRLLKRSWTYTLLTVTIVYVLWTNINQTILWMKHDWKQEGRNDTAQRTMPSQPTRAAMPLFSLSSPTSKHHNPGQEASKLDTDHYHLVKETIQGSHRFAIDKLSNEEETRAVRDINLQPIVPLESNASNLALCGREDVIKGKWVPSLLADGAPYISTTEHLRCYNKSYYKQKPFPSWKWQPQREDCHFTTWSKTTFCSVAKHATVMIVGDSLSWEHYSSLVQLLSGHPIRQGFQHQSKMLQQNIVHSVCPETQFDGAHETSVSKTVRLVFRRDDRLLNLSSAIQDDFPSILVLNKGAHYVNDTRLMQEMEPNWTIVRNWFHQCQQVHGIRCHLFWRTSVPGHPKCAEFDQPVNDLATMETWIANLSNYAYNPRAINYHWYDYQAQNKLLLLELEKQFGPPVTSMSSTRSSLSYGVLDAYYLNVLRPDEHRSHQGDCLHNCYPGKMDVMSQLLLHFLRMSTTQSEMEQRYTWWARQQRGRTHKLDSVYEKAAVEEERQRQQRNKRKRRVNNEGHLHHHHN